MAEVLGTVVGVVSLGLQVCSGIIKYLDGIKGHRHDIATTSRLCDSVQRRLFQLEAMKDDITAATNDAGFEIDEAMSSVKTELTNLSAFMDTIRSSDDPSRSFSDWLTDRKTRATFPFRRDHLDHLKSHLGQADRTLQAALQMEEIRMGIASANAFRRIENKVTEINTCSISKLEGISQQSAQNRHELGILSDNVSQIGLGLETFVPHAQEYIENSTIQMTLLQNQLEGVLQALSSPDPKIVLARLLSKPDVLRMVCAEATIEGQSSGLADSYAGINRRTTESKNPFDCRCKPRSTRTQTVRRFGPALFTAERCGHQVHTSRCPLAGISHSKGGWSFGLSGRLSRLVLSIAITVSIATSFGAGGSGLSTSFRVYFLRKDSPAWDTVKIIRRASVLDSEGFFLILRRGIDILKWTFKTGKASPYDIHSSNRSLLHAACYSECGVNLHSVQRMRPLFEFLVAVGVPREHPDESGAVPMHLLFWWFADSIILSSESDEIEIDEIGIGAISMSSGHLMPDDCSTYVEHYASCYIVFFQELFKKAPIDIQYYGTDLHTTIVRKDEQALAKALEKGLQALELLEPNTFGFTSLELLIAWPAGLDLVMSHMGYRLRQTNDEGRYSVLACALYQSRQLCLESETSRCPNACRCAVTTSKLLELNCRIDLGNLLMHCLWFASTRCQEAVIRHLGNRRKELMQLAMQELSPTEIIEFGVSEDAILDGRTYEVVQALERRKVEIPRWLRTEDITPPFHRRASIYHLICYSEDFTGSVDRTNVLVFAFANGFKEFDAPDANGRTPSMITTTPTIFQTLMKLGADPLKQMPDCVPGYTATHGIFFVSELSEWPDIDPKEFWALVRSSGKLAQHRSPEDECRCKCSMNGCHPLTILCKARLSNSWVSNYGWKRRGLATRLGDLMANSEGFWGLDPSSVAIVIRVATFEKLSIRHTCCRNGWRTGIDEQEINNLNDEDAIRIKHLEDLVPEFEAAFERMECDVSEFFETYWKDRMSEVLDELDGKPLTKENLQGIEDLGIRLIFEDDESSVGSEMSSVGQETPLVGYFMEELDRIADGLGT